MRKGFTLLELIVVIIILGVLATLGLTQYGRMVERSRGAEARAILGNLRKFAAGYYMEWGSTTGMPANLLGLGTQQDQVPTVCRGSHYFSYGIAGNADPEIGFGATRCITGSAGKPPNSSVAFRLALTTNFLTGADTWTTDAGY